MADRIEPHVSLGTAGFPSRWPNTDLLGHLNQHRMLQIWFKVDGNESGFSYFFFSSTGNRSIFAARMKSFSLRPPIAWVQSSIQTLR